MSEKITQTAGRNQLGEFAPMFAHLNDDVLFGEVNDCFCIVYGDNNAFNFLSCMYFFE